MIHDWIRPHESCPFSALGGIGGGVLTAGQPKMCDNQHSS